MNLFQKETGGPGTQNSGPNWESGMKPSSIRPWHLEQFIGLSLTSYLPWPPGVGRNKRSALRRLTDGLPQTTVWGLSRSGAIKRLRPTTSHQLQPLQARMPVLADDDVIMYRNPERPSDVDDRLGHVDIGARRRRVAARMIVQNRPIRRKYLKFIDQ